MLVNCPKCGFSQPKDRYCASCGVDMEQFKPAPTPLLKAMVTNPVFLIALTVGIVMGSIVYIRHKQREELANRAEMLKAGPLIVEQTTPISATEAASLDVNSLPSPSPSTTPETTPTPAGALSPAVVSAASPSPSPQPSTTPESRSAAAADSAPLRKITVNAVYAEVDRQALINIYEESQTTGQFTDFGDFKAGALPNIASRMGRDRGVKVLQKITREFDSKHTQHKWFVGNKAENDDDVGLTTLMLLENSADGHLRGEIELLRSLHEGGEGVVKKSYPISSFDLPARTGWFIQVKMPNTFDQFGSEEIAPDGFLRLFKSTDFKTGATEFTLFFDFDSKAP